MTELHARIFTRYYVAIICKVKCSIQAIQYEGHCVALNHDLVHIVLM